MFCILLKYLVVPVIVIGYIVYCLWPRNTNDFSLETKINLMLTFEQNDIGKVSFYIIQKLKKVLERFHVYRIRVKVMAKLYSTIWLILLLKAV